jgi:hypothetical protein
MTDLRVEQEERAGPKPMISTRFRRIWHLVSEIVFRRTSSQTTAAPGSGVRTCIRRYTVHETGGVIFMQQQSMPDGGPATNSDTFEQAFAEVERSAQAAGKAGGSIVSAARQLQKAAQEGDISKIRKASDKLATVTNAARQDIANARTAWQFSDSDEKDYMLSRYTQELCEEAERTGLKIYERDARLLAYPSILQVLPNDLAVRIDRKRVTAIRPSHLVRILKANQTKKSRFPVERFLESLFNAYKLHATGENFGATIKLARVYDSLTLLPGAANEYNKSDFARDIFMVDHSGVSQTKSGHRMTLPASTATRGSKSDLFTFVAPDGEIATYYGIRFTES